MIIPEWSTQILQLLKLLVLQLMKMAVDPADLIQQHEPEKLQLHAFIYKQRLFSTQPQCFLTFYSMGSSEIPWKLLVRSKS